MAWQETDETKSRAALERDLRDRENPPRLDESERLAGVDIKQLELVDSFDPAYEFEVVGEVEWFSCESLYLEWQKE